MSDAIFIIGCGAVGNSLGFALIKAGIFVSGVYDLNPKKVKHASQLLGVRGGFGDFPACLKEAETIIVTVPDSAIQSVAKQVVAQQAHHKKQVWLHCSGQLTENALLPLKSRVAGVGSMHPAFVFPPGEVTPVPTGVFFAVGGERAAVERATWMVQHLNGTALEVASDARTLYHAALVTASNYVATLLSTAKDILDQIQIPADQIEPLIIAMAQSAITRAGDVGIENALSGPIRRGDAGTVGQHLKALDVLPEVKKMYIAVGEATLNNCIFRPDYSKEDAKEILTLLTKGTTMIP